MSRGDGGCGIHVICGVHGVRGAHGGRGGYGGRGVHGGRGGSGGRDGSGGRGGYGRLGSESRCEHLPQRPRQHLREALVRAGAHLEPDRRAVVDQQQEAARVGECGDRALRVAGELLPDAFPQGDLSEFSLFAQPGLDLGEREGRAGLGAADRSREVGVPTTPVADGRAAHACQPCDTGGGHLSRVVLHPHAPLVVPHQPCATRVTPSIPMHARSTSSRPCTQHIS